MTKWLGVHWPSVSPPFIPAA